MKKFIVLVLVLMLSGVCMAQEEAPPRKSDFIVSGVGNASENFKFASYLILDPETQDVWICTIHEKNTPKWYYRNLQELVRKY